MCEAAAADGASIFLFKLALASAAFVLIGWIGARDKRVGGLLLTFPLLNGVAMLTGVDPIGVAETIYVMVIWNCLLFWGVMHWFELLPPLSPAVGANARIMIRVLAWAMLWAVGAAALAIVRDALPGAVGLFVLSAALAAVAVAGWWRAPPRAVAVTFASMWLNPSGFARVAFFVASFVLLAGAALHWPDPRVVGVISAMPLPGLFALALLSVTQSKVDLISLGDTVLMGPLLVIPFNWLLSRAVSHLCIEEAGTLAQMGTVATFWLVAAVVFTLTPPFARWRDRVGRAGRPRA
jgi:hypothetical protein